MARRLAVLLVAAATGAVFAIGLFVHGWVGAILLLLTDAVLIALTRVTWARLRPQGRPMRLAVIAVIAGIAVAKVVSG
jgi:hypothetical protein